MENLQFIVTQLLPVRVSLEAPVTVQHVSLEAPVTVRMEVIE